MPNVGITVESCILTEWHKKTGDTVQTGEPLFTYETDKSTLEENAPCDGTLLAQFFETGDEIPVMTHVAVIGAEGEDCAAFAPSKTATAPPVATPVQAAEVPVATAVPAYGRTGSSAPTGISPRAKALAAKIGADLRGAVPTGPEDRIIERDVRRLLETGPLPTPAAAPQFEGGAGTGLGGRFRVADIVSAAPAPVAYGTYSDEKMPMIRRTIAKQMLYSLASTAQLTHTLSFDAAELLAFREKIKAGGATLGYGNASLNDMILFVVSRTLKEPTHRALNAHLLEGDVLRCFDGVHLGLAVDTPRGLFVPTIFDADQKSLAELSAECRSLAALCREGKAAPEQLQGASFSVSNLGVFGIESFTPILNAPQTGLLGVNTITTQIRVEAGAIVPYQAMSLSLTYDHRAVDGAPASRFLADLKQNFERFAAFAAEHDAL